MLQCGVVDQAVQAIGNCARDVACRLAIAVVEGIVDAGRFPHRDQAGAAAVFKDDGAGKALVVAYELEGKAHVNIGGSGLVEVSARCYHV